MEMVVGVRPALNFLAALYVVLCYESPVCFWPRGILQISVSFRLLITLKAAAHNAAKSQVFNK